MKRLSILSALCACLLLCACAGGIRMPSYASHYLYEPLNTVEADMRALGFTDIDTIEVENDMGLDYAGDVSSISIAGDSGFDEGQAFPEDSKVTISYYGEYSQERQEQDRIREEQKAAEEAAAAQAAAEKAAAEQAAAEQKAAEEQAAAEQKAAEEQAAAEQQAAEQASQNSGEVTVDFKTAMDSYEQFFNEYVEYMKTIEGTDDPGVIVGAMGDYMTQYADTMSKLDAIDEDSLSPADYAYYMEVHGRIMQKLAELY